MSSRKITQKIGWLCIWLWALCVGCPSKKQPEGMRSSQGTVYQSSAGAINHKGTVYALLVGVNKYQDSRWDTLEYAEKDAEGVYRVLTTEGRVPAKNIKLLLGKSANLEMVLRTLEKLRKRAKVNDTLFLMFASHGSVENGVNYLALYDTDQDKLRTTGLRSTELRQEVKTRLQVLFLDACHSGIRLPGERAKGARSVGAMATVIDAEKFSGQGNVVVASSMQTQKSFEDEKLKHGWFTYALMEALRGKADENKDGVVTLFEAFTYVNKRVKEFVANYNSDARNEKKREQNPMMYGEIGSEIALSFPGQPQSPNRQQIAPIDKSRLSVTSTPPGATVYIDRANEGETPWEGELEAGRRILELRKEGYQTQKDIINLRRGRHRQVTYTLQQLVSPDPPVPAPAPVATVIPPPPPKSNQAGDRQTFTVDRTSFAMRFIPAGRFTMGSPTSEQDVVISDCVRSGSSQTDCNSWYRAESPQRVVELTRSFWKMETEVTQGQFQSVMEYNPSHFKNCGLNCPVESVNWHEACAFANALSRKQGLEECYTCSGSGTGVTCEVKSQYSGSGYYNCKGWRLPTEAEWEYAARSGVHAAIYKGKFEIKGTNNAPALDAIAWYSGNSGVSYEGGFDCSNWSEKQYSSSRCGTHPVGRKQSNMWGLHDMLGNVFEWVHDWYQDSYRDLTGKDPVNDRTGSERVLRGGSWNFHARVMRAANRFWWTPTNRFFYVGFRLLRGDLSSR